MKSINYQSKIGFYATLLAAGSFAIGTLLLGLRMLLPANGRILAAAFYYAEFFAMAHIIALLLLLCRFVFKTEARHYYAKKIFLLLCNIPVAGFYAYVAFEIID